MAFEKTIQLKIVVTTTLLALLLKFTLKDNTFLRQSW